MVYPATGVPIGVAVAGGVAGAALLVAGIAGVLMKKCVYRIAHHPPPRTKEA